MNASLQDYIRLGQLQQRLKARYYRLTTKESFSAKDLARGISVDGFSDTEVLAIAERVLLQTYIKSEARHHMRLARG